MVISPSSAAVILIVEDEKGPRQALLSLLQPQYSVYTAESLSEARSLLQQCQIDLVILDLKLPDGDGTLLLREIHAAGSPTAVIIVTGYGSVESAVVAQECGAAGYLLKPFNGYELMTLTHQILPLPHDAPEEPS